MRQRRFTDYHEARKQAQEYANEMQMDVYIRRQKEYGKDGYNIGLASRNDSDYAVAEIVQPTTKKE